MCWLSLYLSHFEIEVINDNDLRINPIHPPLLPDYNRIVAGLKNNINFINIFISPFGRPFDSGQDFPRTCSVSGTSSVVMRRMRGDK